MGGGSESYSERCTLLLVRCHAVYNCEYDNMSVHTSVRECTREVESFAPIAKGVGIGRVPAICIHCPQ
jgi:hypothetical protein